LATPSPAVTLPAVLPTFTPRPTPTATPFPTPPPTASPVGAPPLVATGVRRLSFQHCTPSGGQFVCPFTVTFDWNDPGGTGGTIAWRLWGSVMSKSTGCSVAVPFSAPETTAVGQETAGPHTWTVNGTLTVSADPAGPAAQNPSTATASLEGGGGSVGPVAFYGGSTC
jgi:hypothetical protein